MAEQIDEGFYEIDEPAEAMQEKHDEQGAMLASFRAARESADVATLEAALLEEAIAASLVTAKTESTIVGPIEGSDRSMSELPTEEETFDETARETADAVDFEAAEVEEAIAASLQMIQPESRSADAAMLEATEVAEATAASLQIIQPESRTVSPIEGPERPMSEPPMEIEPWEPVHQRCLTHSTPPELPHPLPRFSSEPSMEIGPWAPTNLGSSRPGPPVPPKIPVPGTSQHFIPHQSSSPRDYVGSSSLHTTQVDQNQVNNRLRDLVSRPIITPGPPRPVKTPVTQTIQYGIDSEPTSRRESAASSSLYMGAAATPGPPRPPKTATPRTSVHGAYSRSTSPQESVGSSHTYATRMTQGNHNHVGPNRVNSNTPRSTPRPELDIGEQWIDLERGEGHPLMEHRPLSFPVQSSPRMVPLHARSHTANTLPYHPLPNEAEIDSIQEVVEGDPVENNDDADQPVQTSEVEVAVQERTCCQAMRRKRRWLYWGIFVFFIVGMPTLGGLNGAHII